jgi:hypothetical protein
MTSSAPAPRDCHVVELRRYTLHPGARDTLVALFDREFVETQEACGMAVLGQFRELDAPERFVWLRGFAGMAARRAGLEAFYGGPVWAAHREAANATMVDSDDVFLLRPAWPGAALQGSGERAGPGARAAPAGLLDATVFPLRPGAEAAAIALAREAIAPRLAATGALAQGWYVSEPAPNDFPRLPVRTDTPVLVGLALFPEVAAHAAFAAGGRWRRELAPLLAALLARPPEAHRLAPTPRSALHA